ncbi:MAG: DUF3343 domain-containing protein [Candidatus Sabulitectum sp.]|nr:DUF3343 domain-containing protein [Candidatus Sabulitectum sp.]
MSDYLYMIFQSMTHVLTAERAARKGGIACRMVPIPRNVSTDCGMCISVKVEDGRSFLSAVKEKGITPERVEEHRGSGPKSRCYST